MSNDRAFPAFPPSAGTRLALRRLGHATRTAQTLGIEWLDSARQGLDDLAATAQRLAAARNPAEVLAVQTAYLSRAGERFTARATAANSLVATLAGDLMNPVASRGDRP
ncbi:phasin family protein [Methylobacterium sp. A49B]|uniref:Phasin family protein n=1 Tax=Methylobacterium mesophilicum SR1.6/6 TaxID=908290 RepID=A0A6B9FMW6_9HYPH|nr:phasin family protein [Methylobacterium mesophilicum]QGY03903.1 phasin family protein [Methylobacterium mesophilicum SR1.6/6]